MKNWKRYLSIAMTLVMLLGVLPTAAFAEGEDPAPLADPTITLTPSTAEYTGSDIEIGVTVTGITGDYTLSCDKGGTVNSEKTKITVKNADTYTVTATQSEVAVSTGTFTISKKPITDLVIAFDGYNESGYTYDKSSHVPTVTANKTGLDYDLEFRKDGEVVDSSSIIGAGEYTVCAKLKGNYKGSSNTLTFKINQAEWSVTGVSVAEHTYNGNPPKVTVIGGADSSEYAVTHWKGDTKLDQPPVDAGSYTVKVSPTANYTGTPVTADYTIKQKTWDVAEVKVNGVTDGKYAYDGQVPVVSVKDGAGTSVSTEQYTLAYKKGNQSIDALSKDVGSYTVTVTPKPNYTGTDATGTDATGNSITVNYTIEPKKLTEPWVADIDAVTYNGTEFTPTPEVKESETGKTLVKDTDYTLAYSNNTNAGTGKVTIRFSDNYQVQGSLEKTFTIHPIAINNPVVTVSNTGYRQQLTVAVTNNGAAVAAKDYTLTYAAGDSDTFTTSVPVNVGSYKVKATLSENYSGTPNSVVKPFSITGIAVANPSITVSGNLGYTGSAVVPVIEVKNDGKVVAAKDYTLTFYKAKSESEYEEITAAQLIAAGNYKVKATLGSNYTGSTKTVEQTFTIARKSISDAVVTFTESVFTESSYKNAKPSVKLGTKTLSLGVDYSLTYGDVNTTTHKASITVTGLGNYTGTVEKEVTISGGSDIAAYILAAVDDTFDFDNKLTVLSLKSAYNTLTETEQKAVRDTVGTTVWNKFISRVNQKMYSLKNEPSRGYYTYTKGTSSNVVIEINADFDRTYVTEIRMGKNLTVIERQHYEVKRGSVVVTLSSSYLKNIKTSGTYNLYIDLLDDSGYTETVQTKVYVRSATDIPQTGDPFKMNLWIGLLGASVLALAGLGAYEVVKKKKNAQKRLDAAMNLDEESSDETNTNE